MVCLRLIGIRKLAVAPKEPVSHPAHLAVPADSEMHALILSGFLRIGVERERWRRWQWRSRFSRLCYINHQLVTEDGSNVRPVAVH